MKIAQQHAAIAAIIILSGSLPSCVMPDPMFTQNAGMIQDINYPSSKIVGTWASVQVAAIQTDTVKMEDKTYYEFFSNGRGKTRQSSKNRATGSSISMEANFRWKYQGANTWKIMLPASSEYRVIDNQNMAMGNVAAREGQLRYYQGNLYEMDTRQIWVRATAENIANLAKRHRENDPIIQLNLDEAQ